MTTFTKHLLLLLLFFSLSASAFDMRQYHAQHYNQPKDQFLKFFPYQKYLQSVGFTDFQTLQQHRYFLYQKMGDGDGFLYHLGENFIKHYPVTANQLALKTTIGEQFIAPKQGLSQGMNEIYQIIGYFILGKVAQKIKTEIKAKRFDPTDAANDQLIQRLQKNKIYVSVEESTSTKLIKNAKKGNWDYILQRVGLKIQEHYDPILKMGGANALLVGVGLLVVLIVLFLKGGKMRTTAIILFALLTIAPIFVGQVSAKDGQKDGTGTTTPPSRNPVFKLKFRSNYGNIPGTQESAINVMDIEHKTTQQKIGQTVWMQRPYAKASYFAHQNVPGKYQQFKRNNKVILATTGGFTNVAGKPEGLTVENGTIVNAVIMHDRHGLVMVQKGGGIRIFNLKRSTFDLPLSSQKVKTIGNPLHSLVAYSELLDWCKTRKATLFQTQLLAYSDQMMISRSKAKTQLRERRLLVLFSDGQTHEVHHAIFNIEDSFNLAEIADEIFHIVSSRNKKVEAILNLDVGSYNILEVYNDSGRQVLSAPVPVGNATNLIIYSR